MTIPDPTAGHDDGEHRRRLEEHEHEVEMLMSGDLAALGRPGPGGRGCGAGLLLAHGDHGDHDGGADFPEALRKIATDVARHRAGTYVRPTWWTDYTQARLGLDSLARWALTSPSAMDLLARFAEGAETQEQCEVCGTPDLDTEIEGARVFGCVLHLAGHPISAAFWWQIAAGAGDRTAAFAIYLQRLQRGDVREAQWWLQEATRPDATLDGAATMPGLPDMPGYLRVPSLLSHWEGTESPQPAAVLAAEVDRLVVRTAPGDPALIDGVAGRLGPDLATRVEELASRC